MSRGLAARVKALERRQKAAEAAVAVESPPDAETILERHLAATGHVPDPWQRRVLAAMPKRLVCTAARQVGKGSLCAAAALSVCVAEPGVTVLVVSASERQAKIVLGRMREMLPYLGSHAAGVRDTQTDLRFPCGSVVVVLPSSSSSLRGWTCRFLLLDEAAQIAEESWAAVIPTVAATGGDVWALSSAGPPAGWFFQVATETELYPEWMRVRVRAEELARYSREHLAAERRRLPRSVYQREYESEFVGSDLGVFEPELLDRAFRGGQQSAATSAFDLSDLLPAGGVR